MHVLRVSEHAAAARDGAVLSEEERARAAAFLREADRDRYRVAHTALRHELAAHLGTAPADVPFVREPCPLCARPHGRPAVPGNPVHFSLSHAGDVVLLAFDDAPVGADVEKHPSARAVAETAGALHPRERAEIGALPAAGRPAAFARCWTRKEAYLKGTGTGLGEAPDVTYVGTLAVPAEVPGWSLADVPVPEGYAAAVAVAVPRPADPGPP
ncbi:4-phosphopantetheinyl transferase [Streptomyces carminius]|uniref:4-phosphopantetheinyl transferase n=1 Tax=Streptomyces carminius TaxID=2665496 RepID=A0A2M8LPN8_9ACTN|nr:4'-phosphopantetheinyl transferase superfamily protein [Streptomyces carminius]PJE93917.1 4-phosphopantetheinyl transferase [Streptomyces carminius]